VGFEGTDEYDPAGDDHTDLPKKMAQAMLQESTPGVAAKIVVEKWDAERRVVQVVAHQPTHLVLRLVDYPAWRVTVNGKPVSVQHPEGTRQMIVPLPAEDSEVRIEFTRTIDRTIGGWISVVSGVGCFCLVIWKRRDSRSATS
jgi:hypothetical protein